MFFFFTLSLEINSPPFSSEGITTYILNLNLFIPLGFEHLRGDYWTLAGGDFGSLISRININGGIILNPVNAGIYISATKYTFRRIAIINVI